MLLQLILFKNIFQNHHGSFHDSYFLHFTQQPDAAASPKFKNRLLYGRIVATKDLRHTKQIQSATLCKVNI